ncbi:bifunctional folylpolyglutamate synthase/dihydrofolate synthase [Virgibacillus kekensis]|uniref:tetrahydrofolate synthase n=1 Tax=Virgibacillus kekensis TaxID=202261 RepID=A0ABV9DKN7_9BACI
MFENYQQADDFLKNRAQYGMKPGLDRINTLLKLLGNPQKRIKAVHIAGTNGKGSTVQFLKHALMQNGYQVGVFTSPSFDGFPGHIFLNEQMISDTNLTMLLNEIQPYIEQLDQEGNHPTEFEIITVAAFMYFAQVADIALIEAGMGGREDTTNCFLPMLSIITNVAMDHTAFLGKTIEKIAYQKAGIIKERTPVISGVGDGDALQVIKAEAHKNKAPLYLLNKDFTYTPIPETADEQVFVWKSEAIREVKVSLKVDGEHQERNASLAVKALELLQSMGFNTKWDINLKALNRTQIPGRFEKIHNNPIVILDGAHNPAGVTAFVDTVTKNFPDYERHLIFAAFKDKDISNMLKMLVPHFTTVTLTTFDHPRAADIKQLRKYMDLNHVKVVGDWEETVSQLEDQQINRCYFFTGSLYFIKNVRKYFERF